MTFDPMALARNMMRLADEDKLVALTWLERAAGADADDVARALLVNILEGAMEFIVEHGELRFRLTEQGRAAADELIANNPEGQRMLAALLKATRIEGPKDPQ